LRGDLDNLFLFRDYGNDGSHHPFSLSRRSHPSTTLSLVATPAPMTTTSPASPLEAPRSSSSLSPDAQPFLPFGRSKEQRWEDTSPFDSNGGRRPPRPASFREVLLLRPARQEHSTRSSAVPATAPRPKLLSAVGLCTLRPPKVDEEGWHLVESRHSRCRHLRQAHRPLRKVPHDLTTRCFNCFSFLHRAAACRCRTRCFRYLEPGHHVARCPRWFIASRPERRLLAWWLAPAPSVWAAADAALSGDSHRGPSRRRSRHRRWHASRSRHDDPTPPAVMEEFTDPGLEPAEQRPPRLVEECSSVPVCVVPRWKAMQPGLPDSRADRA
jgi:hypothetical protein